MEAVIIFGDRLKKQGKWADPKQVINGPEGGAGLGGNCVFFPFMSGAQSFFKFIIYILNFMAI